MKIGLGLCAVALVCFGTAAWSKTVATDGMTQASQWAAQPQFSFVYDGRNSDDLLKDWTLKKSSRKLDKNRTERILAWSDAKTGLVVKCVAVQYKDFPTVEWTLYFKNTGSSDTPILEKIFPLDVGIDSANGEFILNHSRGSQVKTTDFEPLQTALGPGSKITLSGTNGVPSEVSWPYFNLEWQGQGAIVAVGWPGQWSANFTRDEKNGLRVRVGQELTHFKLLPGEEVRTPLIVAQFWDGDRARTHNVWRRWMLAHNVPRPAGKLPEPQLFGCSSLHLGEMTKANEANQVEFINRYVEEGIKIGHWWMDAGWYPCDEIGWPKTGTWEVDRRRFPNGLRAISDYAHSKNIKTILWFEPERVMPDTWLTVNHPEWVIGGANGGLLDLGNPEALHWLIDRVDQLMKDECIDRYRSDFNFTPLPFWRGKDAPDRQGITEIKHVVGYLEMWDELLRRHPNMFIDNCASGGRRNDLESMRRAIPLWRSDYMCVATGSQSHTYGLSHWLPYSGTGVAGDDPYNFRSNMVPFTNCLWDMRNMQLNYDGLRRLSSQFYKLSKYWLGDYYPLTPYSTQENVWMAWQFDCPEIGEGMVQAFRRPQSDIQSVRLKLFGLDPKARYTVRNLDETNDDSISGRELMETGLLVNIPAKPGAVVITYKSQNVWNLAADWQVGTQTGAWTYYYADPSNGNAITQFSSYAPLWITEPFSAWYLNPNGTAPWLGKNMSDNSNNIWAIDPGAVISLPTSNSNIYSIRARWTSPISGNADVAGSLKTLGDGNTYAVSLNGTSVLTSGIANPGISATIDLSDITVGVGDYVEMQIGGPALNQIDFTVVAAPVALSTWDLARDWQAGAQNGEWTYYYEDPNDGNALKQFSTYSTGWYGADLSAWYWNASGAAPWLAKNVKDYPAAPWSIPVGAVIDMGSVRARWTSPTSGSFDITGSVSTMGAGNTYAVSLNGVTTLNSGTANPGIPASINLSGVTVGIGDYIELQIGGTALNQIAFTVQTAIVPASISSVRSLTDGTKVSIADVLVATAGSSTFADGSYYIETEGRSCGIKVIGGGAVPEGVRISNLVGTMATDANGERMIVVGAMSASPGDSLGALGMPTKTVAGSTVTGLLARTWGRVISKASDNNCVTIDDGGGVGVRVILSGLNTPITKTINETDYVAVTGPVGLVKDGIATIPAIRPRCDADIDVF